ncbi:hypothetical protein EDC01DRAFT_667534, partial [Geopyxis carbonaria]
MVSPITWNSDEELTYNDQLFSITRHQEALHALVTEFSNHFYKEVLCIPPRHLPPITFSAFQDAHLNTDPGYSLFTDPRNAGLITSLRRPVRPLLKKVDPAALDRFMELMFLIMLFLGGPQPPAKEAVDILEASVQNEGGRARALRLYPGPLANMAWIGLDEEGKAVCRFVVPAAATVVMQYMLYVRPRIPELGIMMFRESMMCDKGAWAEGVTKKWMKEKMGMDNVGLEEYGTIMLAIGKKHLVSEIDDDDDDDDDD